MTEASEPPSEPSGGGSGTPTNRKAIASLLFGIAGFACLFVFPYGAFALGIPSLTTGIHARREIAESDGSEGGDGLAVYGLLIGGVGLFFGVIALGLSSLPRA